MKFQVSFQNYFPKHQKWLQRNQLLQEQVQYSDVVKLVEKLSDNPEPFCRDLELRVPSYKSLVRKLGEEQPIPLRKYPYPEDLLTSPKVGAKQHFIIEPVPSNFFHQKLGQVTHLTSYRGVEPTDRFLKTYTESKLLVCPTWGTDKFSMLINTWPTESVFKVIQELDFHHIVEAQMNYSLAVSALTVPILYHGLEYLDPTVTPYSVYYPLVLDVLAYQDSLPNVHLKTLNLTPSQEYIVNRSTLNYICRCINDKKDLTTHLNLDPILDDMSDLSVKLKKLELSYHYLR